MYYLCSRKQINKKEICHTIIIIITIIITITTFMQEPPRRTGCLCSVSY